MEVHHHAHTARKKWTHYFWEFLMLFLAVFCGFLAEYQLEHKIERDRGKQFMKSMIADLKKDITMINTVNPVRLEKHRTFDSLTSSIFSKTYTSNGADFYYWARIISRQVTFESTDGTMQQLKNSGGLRLITNRVMADSIMAYDVLYKRIQASQELEKGILKDYRDVASKIFDAEVFNKMFLKGYDYSLSPSNYVHYMERPEGNPQLRKNSEELLNELANRSMYWFNVSGSLYINYEELKQKAERLILLLEKTSK
ncbi:MAG: hypothetical protein KBF82_11560 [Chitinophagaceae bacterium]|nr:hypothetical protein [Chitinophagaceae bacterium]MBP9104495.1 hypothetical protein [Chitinophagaceae bacterium]